MSLRQISCQLFCDRLKELAQQLPKLLLNLELVKELFQLTTVPSSGASSGSGSSGESNKSDQEGEQGSPKVQVLKSKKYKELGSQWLQVLIFLKSFKIFYTKNNRFHEKKNHCPFKIIIFFPKKIIFRLMSPDWKTKKGQDFSQDRYICTTQTLTPVQEKERKTSTTSGLGADVHRAPSDVDHSASSFRLKLGGFQSGRSSRYVFLRFLFFQPTFFKTIHFVKVHENSEKANIQVVQKWPVLLLLRKSFQNVLDQTNILDLQKDRPTRPP